MKFTYHEHINRTWRGQKVTPMESNVLFVLFSRIGSRRGDYVTCSDIIEHLWPDPDYEPEFADHNVKIFISRIRKNFGADCIETDSRLGYRIAA